jgi:hypothetical protein
VAKPRGDVMAEGDLRALVNAADGPLLWFVAKGFQDREFWLGQVRECFPPDIVKRVERVVQIAEAAEQVLLRRLLRELAAE